MAQRGHSTRDLEDMMPFERDLMRDMLIEKLKKEAEQAGG